jgi:CHASE3 domain sensor protein
MAEDILTEFEEKEPKWTWHDELTFTLILIVFSPIIIIAAIYTSILKSKQQSNEQHKGNNDKHRG